MSDDLWEQAIREAYASAPIGEVIISAIELIHPAFTNEDDEITPIRLVREEGNTFAVVGSDPPEEVVGFYLTLEDTAPYNGGESVLFISCAFDFELPSQQEGSLPSIQIKIDNVGRLISKYLDEIVEYDEPIQVIYREYVLSDLETPQHVLEGMSIKTVNTNITTVTATANFANFIDKNFPSKLYRPEEFKGLLK